MKRTSKPNREVRNIIIIALGFTSIFLIFLFHLVGTLNYLLCSYNNLVDQTNSLYNATLNHRSLNFFGEGVESLGLWIDIIIVAVIIIIGLIVYLSIYWSIKHE